MARLTCKKCGSTGYSAHSNIECFCGGKLIVDNNAEINGVDALDKFIFYIRNVGRPLYREIYGDV